MSHEKGQPNTSQGNQTNAPKTSASTTQTNPPKSGNQSGPPSPPPSKLSLERYSKGYWGTKIDKG